MGALFSIIGGAILKAVLPSIATIVSGMVMALLRKKLKRMDIELTEAQDQRLTDIVTERIKAAEEFAHRQAKEGTIVTGEEKLNKVVTETIEVVKENKSIPDPSPSKIRSIVDATLPLLRMVLPKPHAVVDPTAARRDAIDDLGRVAKPDTK